MRVIHVDKNSATRKMKRRGIINFDMQHAIVDRNELIIISNEVSIKGDTR